MIYAASQRVAEKIGGLGFRKIRRRKNDAALGLDGGIKMMF